MGSYAVEKAKIRYGLGTAGVLNCLRNKNKVTLEISFIENAEIRYCWGFDVKIRYGWGLNLFKMQK